MPDNREPKKTFKDYTSEELVNAVESGSAWAWGLKAGDFFLGALVEARSRYPEDDILQRLFTSTAMDVLEKHVVEAITSREKPILSKYELRR